MHFDLFSFPDSEFTNWICSTARKSPSSVYQPESSIFSHLKSLLHTQGCTEQRFRLLDLWTLLLSRKEIKAWTNFLFLASCIFLFCFNFIWMLSYHNFFFSLDLFPSFQESTHIVPSETYSCFYWFTMNLKEFHYSQWWDTCTDQLSQKTPQWISPWFEHILSEYCYLETCFLFFVEFLFYLLWLIKIRLFYCYIKLE